jgi:hypothetical protein
MQAECRKDATLDRGGGITEDLRDRPPTERKRSALDCLLCHCVPIDLAEHMQRVGGEDHVPKYSDRRPNPGMLRVG